MSRSGGDLRRAFALVLLLLVAAPLPAAAQSSGISAAGIELTRSVQQSLKRLQEEWLQWTGAYLAGNAERAAEEQRQIASTTRQVGFTRVADFSLAAVARALEAAAAGDPGRADWVLDAAEQFDPGRPETSFAGARIALSQGRWTKFVGLSIDGYRRLLASSHREVLLAGLLLWALAVLLVACGLFVLFEIAIRGSALYRDLQGALAPRVGRSAAHAIALLLLVGPVALPSGPLLALLLWSILLWGYQGRSERIVTAFAWLVVGVVPVVADAQVARIAIAQSPPVRALSAFADGRLYGGFFSDLAVLKSALPDDPAVLELTADVHRTLGQWEIARGLYARAIEAEPENSAVLLNLGAYYFRKGDYARANQEFQAAARLAPPSAAAYFNLSMGYSESYLFDDSTEALARAKEIDAEAVDEWVKTPNPNRVLTFNGSLRRAAEIRARLERAWSSEGAVASRLSALRRRGSLAAALGAALAAIGLHFVRRRRGYGEPVAWLPWRASTPSRWLRALLPPLSRIELGEGFAAFATLLLLATLALLPAIGRYVLDLAVGPLPGSSLPGWLAGIGLAAYVALRVRAELAGEAE